MNQPIRRSVFTNASKQCVRCNYDLRGNESGFCPECGAPVSVSIIYTDTNLLSSAKSVLDEEEMVVHSEIKFETDEPISILRGRLATPKGIIWVAAVNFEKACDLLQEQGIPTPRSVKEIQDKTEPYCPQCHHSLDPEGPGECDSCGYTFIWVDVGEPEIDPTDRSCIECGYNLKGNETANCPECGTLHSGNLDAVVETSVHKEIEEDYRRNRQSFHKIMDVIVGMFAFFLVLFLLFKIEYTSSRDSVVIGSVISIVAVLFLVHIIISRSKKSTDK